MLSLMQTQLTGLSEFLATKRAPERFQTRMNIAVLLQILFAHKVFTTCQALKALSFQMRHFEMLLKIKLALIFFAAIIHWAAKLDESKNFGSLHLFIGNILKMFSFNVSPKQYYAKIVK